jgi:hypothetical protein
MSRALALAAALAAGAPPAFDIALKDGRSMYIRVCGPLGATKLEASGEAMGAVELTAAAASLTDEYLDELASTVIFIGSVLEARIR